MCTHVRQNFWKVSSNSEEFKKNRVFCGFHGNGGHFENSTQTMDINSQHHNLLGNQISPKSEDFVFWRPLLVQNHQGHHSKPKWSPYGAAYLTPCKYSFPLKSVHFWILTIVFNFYIGGHLENFKNERAQLWVMIYFCVRFQKDPLYCLNLTFFTPWLPWQRPPFWICSTPNRWHTLRWIFLQSFMKFDERNPEQFLISLFCIYGSCGKVCPTDSDFLGLSRSIRCGCCS